MLQIVHHQEYVERAQKQQQRTFEVAPRRGVLYDRNLHELAMTVQVDSIFADPSEIDDKPAAARTLAALVHTDPEDARTTEGEIAARLAAGRNFAWIARRVTPEVATRVRTLNMKGIYFQKEFQRFYPDNNIAAQVLGYVGVDDNGLGGLEEKFDAQLHGVPGEMYTAMDARRKILGSSEQDPQPGRNMCSPSTRTSSSSPSRLSTTPCRRPRPSTAPSSSRTSTPAKSWLSPFVPPSIPTTFATPRPNCFAITPSATSTSPDPPSSWSPTPRRWTQVVTPDDMVDCQGGQINLYGRIIHDDKSDHFGVIPVHRALEVSSDVGAIKLALKLGPDRLYQYIRSFGFGPRTGIELPGETRGLLRPVKAGSLLHRLCRHRPGRCRHPAAAGLDGLHHRQRRRLSASARPLPHSTPPMPNQKLPTAGRARSSPAATCPIPCPPVRIASSPRWPPPRCAR